MIKNKHADQLQNKKTYALYTFKLKIVMLI